MGTATSHATGCTVPEASPASSSRRFPFRAAATPVAPSAASKRAVARPMPRLAPVATATAPANLIARACGPPRRG